MAAATAALLHPRLPAPLVPTHRRHAAGDRGPLCRVRVLAASGAAARHTPARCAWTGCTAAWKSSAMWTRSRISVPEVNPTRYSAWVTCSAGTPLADGIPAADRAGSPVGNRRAFGAENRPALAHHRHRSRVGAGLAAARCGGACGHRVLRRGHQCVLSTHRGAGSLPVEFAIFRISPEQWRGEDVLAWQKTMGWQLSMNWLEELLRVRMAARVGDEASNMLMPSYTPNGPVIMPPDSSPGATTPRDVPPVTQPGLATPPVARSPVRGAAGKSSPVLADLTALAEIASSMAPAPPLAAAATTGWSPAPGPSPASHCWPTIRISGARRRPCGISPTSRGSAPMPSRSHDTWRTRRRIGHNQRIAWGITALLGDTQDLYVERVNARDQAGA